MNTNSIEGKVWQNINYSRSKYFRFRQSLFGKWNHFYPQQEQREIRGLFRHHMEYLCVSSNCKVQIRHFVQNSS